MSILLDAGPALNFLAVGQQNVLIQLAVTHNLQLVTPERVDAEVEGMAGNGRFERTRALSTWRTLVSTSRVKVLSDDLVSVEFTEAVTRISGRPADERIRSRASLGEIMVLAHASTYAQSGEEVFVLLDESDGRQRALAEQKWLQTNCAAGTIQLWKTGQVLKEAEKHSGWIRDNLSFRTVYNKMRQFDDGLPPLPKTGDGSAQSS